MVVYVKIYENTFPLRIFVPHISIAPGATPLGTPVLNSWMQYPSCMHEYLDRFANGGMHDDGVVNKHL